MAKFFRIRDIAEIFRRHPRTIYRWLDEGYLTGKKVRDSWLIPEEEIERLIRDPFDEEAKEVRR